MNPEALRAALSTRRTMITRAVLASPLYIRTRYSRPTSYFLDRDAQRAQRHGWRTDGSHKPTPRHARATTVHSYR